MNVIFHIKRRKEGIVMKRIYQLLEIINDEQARCLLEEIIKAKDEVDKTLIARFSFRAIQRIKKLKLAGLELIEGFHDDMRGLWIKECEISGRGIAL